MSTPITFFLFCCCWSSYTLSTSALNGNETDHLALLHFKAKITHDPLQVLSSWNASNHFCTWHGVTCSSRHQRVTVLNLTSSRLEGSLSPYIGNLSFLRDLNLEENGFRYEIPQEIGYLLKLQFLGLQNNSFAGEIPTNISRCINLEYIGLGRNELVGNVPPEVSSLSKLRLLYIHRNNLSGEIPPFFGNLSSLELISGVQNNFVGSIPETLSQLKRIHRISFGVNNLSGEIPPSIYNISSLVHFMFPDNQLHGSLPSDIGFTLPNLGNLNVANNHFTGPIPDSISNATNLSLFMITQNKFRGKVPTLDNLYKLEWVQVSLNQLGNGEEDDSRFLNSLVNISSLKLLYLERNKFQGMLPKALGNFSTQLHTLAISYNKFSGSIPDGIGNLVSLEILYLSNNHFTGRIPNSIGKLQQLKQVWISGNEFSGEIPYSLGNLSLLNILASEMCNFQGTIPSSLGRLKKLQYFDFSQNNLSGTIPPEVIGLSSLSMGFDLAQNQLTGKLPSNVGNMINLIALDVSDNKLSGEIPSSLGSCVLLNELIMKGNFFQGNIPSSLISLRGLNNLDLSSNNFSGQIPKYFENFPFLKNLNLSYNEFEGEVPKNGVFKNVSATSFAGNVNLCGGISELHLPPCSNNFSEQTQTQSPSLKLIIPIVVGILLLIGSASLLFIYRWRTTKRNASSDSPLLASILQVSYENLLKATGGFSPENCIGTGGFGSVYKGILDHDGLVAAVKVLNLQHQGASKSFMAECEALRSIRHRNLVKIISACASVDFQGNDFKALVYEFMENGSLEDWLHQNPATNERQEVSRQLNLLERLNIVIDVACALDYLHRYCETPIIHCDLKPSNVLLDRDMIGHVSDFGLARFLPESTNNSSTNQTSSFGVRGTVGYVAPEYGMGSEVATHGDVYSYGILLLELFTEKRPTDEMFSGNLNLHTFVKAALPDKVTEIVVPLLLVPEEREEGDTSTSLTNGNNRRRSRRIYTVTECLISILEIGVNCSAQLPTERMSMDGVVSKLLSIRNKFVEARR